MDNQTSTGKPSSARSGKSTALIVAVLLIAVAIIFWRTRTAVTPETPVATPPDPVLSLTVPAVIPAQPVSIAAVPLSDEHENLLAVIRLRDLRTFTQKLAAFLNTVDPEFKVEEIIKGMTEAGIDPQRCRAGGNAALFAWKPDPVMSAPRVSAIIPIPAYEHSMSSPLPPHFASFDRYTLFGQDQGALDAALPIRNSLLDLAQTPMEDGFAVTLDLRRIWDTYGSVARLGLSTIQGLAGLQLLQHPAFAEQPQTVQLISELLGAAAQTLFKALDQSMFMTMGVDLDPERAQITLTSQARPGSALATAYSGGPFEVPDLLAWLPEGEHTLAVSQESVADWSVAMDFVLDFLNPVAAAMGEPVVRQIEALAAVLPECGPTTIATHLLTDPAQDQPGAMAAEYLILAENPEAMHELLQQQLRQSFSTGFHARLYELLGLECSITVTKQSATGFEGLIRRFQLDLAPAASGKTAMRLPPEALEELTQQIYYELTRLGPYVLMTMQTPVSTLAQHLLSSAPSEGHALFAEYPSGAASIARINPAAFAAMFKGILPPDMPFALTTNWPKADDLPPISMATYSQQGAQMTQVRIPTRLFATLKQILE